MIGGLALIAASCLVVWLAPRILLRLTAASTRPLLGVVAWQLTAWSVVVGCILSAGFVIAPTLETRVEVPYLMQACFDAVGAVADDPHAEWMRGAAALLAALIIGRLVGCAVTGSSRTHHRRVRHRSLLTLVGRHDDQLNAHVVAGETPVVYCVPGPGRFIVFSSAAVERLRPVERRAVRDHERAHLRGRHHLILGSARLLAHAFPGVPLFSVAQQHTARLIEMRADDVAARRYGGAVVAAALLALADVPGAPEVLAATGVSTADRIDRLVQPSGRRLGNLLPTLALCGGVSVLAACPVLLAASTHALLCLV